MSTILDSLKKSSDKRDDNSKNSMDNFSFSGTGQKRNSKSYVVLILLLITATILYFGYQYLYNDDESEQVSIIEQQAAEKSDTTLTPKDVATTEIQAQTETRKRNKPNSSDVKQRIKEIKERRNEQQKALQALQKPPMKQDVPQASMKKPIATIKKDMPQQDLQKQGPNQQPVSSSIELVEVKQTVAEPKHLYAYQLPFSLRKDLPTLKLNIHVFDKDPDNRIAVINGVRFAIEDMIDDVVLVKDIVPEGVLLEFNNRVFLVPK